MDEMDLTLPPDLELALDEFYNAPQPTPNFAVHLEAELRHRFNEPSRSDLKKQFFTEGFMQMLRTRPVLAIIVVVIALLALTGVAYAIGRLTGFIPGYGFTESVQGMYVLDGQVEGKNGNLMVKLEKAVQDDNDLILEVSKAGSDYRISGASIQPEGGEKIYALKKFEVGANWKFVFPRLEDPQKPVTLLLYAMELTGYPNSETVSISFHLRPILPGDMIIQPTDTAPLADHHDGLTLSLDSIAYDKDRTVLQVSLKFDHPGNIGGMWSVALTDQNGIPYPLQDITPPDENYYTTTDMNSGSTTTNINAGDATRVYETTALYGKGPLTLALTVMPASEPFSIYVYDWAEAFKFDPGPNPQIGQTWQLDEKIDVNNIHFHVTSAELLDDGGLKLVFHATAEDPTLYVNLSLDDETLSHAVYSIPGQDGFTITFPLSRMPDKPIQFMLSMSVYKPSDPFQITWQSPTEIDQASGLPTITPIPTAVHAENPIFLSSDPLVLEVQSLMQRYDGWLQKGPGWVHIVHEYSKDPIPNAITIPYARTEEWLEIDENGWVLRSVQTDRDQDGTIIQQIATVGGHSVNLTYGGTFDSPVTYRVSIDNVTQQVQEMLSNGLSFSREVTTCDDGSACLLITSTEFAHSPDGTAFESHSGWRVWINLETGQQVKQEEFHLLEDGSTKVDYTFRYLLIEKVSNTPQEILDILKNVGAP